ncbi:toll/interleukin-1 receptor domain-containing protein [Bacillus thuringiensis]|uniref:toll/interleukin-1 receptor domain-containing protein n=1 Tax=Bacillus thuringiensis TaxID=1428 RepID=UPI002FBDB363
MRIVSITLTHDNIHIDVDHNIYTNEEGISVDFIIGMENIPVREHLFLIKRETENLKWISFEDRKFYFDLPLMQEEFPGLFSDCNWMKGKVTINPSDDECNIDDRTVTVISFSITKEEIESTFPQKIFLSHKGANKPMVRKYFDLLKGLGFEPWMDEKNLVNGDALERGLLKGMKESCACVFFITPEFKDEHYLADEINYAKREKKEKREKFNIITLQFTNEEGEQGVVPDILTFEVYTSPNSELDAFNDIIRSLPIQVGHVKWRKN